MKFAVIGAAILSSISRAGCFEATSHGSPGRAPRSANALHKVLRVMMQHAIDIGLRADDPTREGS